MIITVYYKGPEAPKTATFEIDLEEFKRLSRDFAGYLQSGQPGTGEYLCRTVLGDQAIKRVYPVKFKFSEISLIG